MSLSLDPSLSAAQDNSERRPIVKLISTQHDPAVPFDGEYFNSNDDPEINPSLMSHSSGRLVSVYVRNDDELIFLYTDTDRTFWTEVVIDLGLVVNYSIINLSVCELSDGNVGIILIEKHSTTYVIQYMIVTELGIEITSPTNIAQYTSPSIVDETFVCQLQDDSFLLVYAHYDGTDYSIYKRTSTDFVNWGNASSIALSGFDSTHNTNNPSLIQVASGDILLFLDHATDKSGDSVVTNIFSLISSDNGITWGVPGQLTSYSDWSSSGVHPYPALTSDNVVKLAFHETNSVLFMTTTENLWQSDCGALADRAIGTSIHYDSVTKKLYVQQILPGTGNGICGVVVIDVDNWEVDRNYNTGTVPSYSSLFFETYICGIDGGQKNHSEGKYTAISTQHNYEMATMVINNETETITTYVFKTKGSYDGISANMDGWDGRTESWETWSYIYGTWVDAQNDKVYLVMGYGHGDLLVGYIDLTEIADPITGHYTFHEVAWITSWNETEILGLGDSSGGIIIINETNRFCLYGIASVDTWAGRFGIYDLSTGNTIKEYTWEENPSFPFQGIGHCVYKNNHIYGMISYNTIHGQDIYRGLCDINVVNETITYHRPSYATLNQYDLFSPAVKDNDNIIFAAWGYGVAIYNTDDDSWGLFNNDNVVGFEPLDTYNVVSIAYNSLDKIIYVGSITVSGFNGWAGIRAIPEAGSFNQGKYMIGTLTVNWSFAEPEDLSLGLSDYDFAIAIDADDILWAVWVRQDLSLCSIKWDKDQADFDLTSYLVGSVSVSWDIENINNLTFKLSHGHLFDSNNSLSALNIFSKKGRPVTLRFGENIGEIEYWQNQGTFYIKSTKVSYERDKYPVISLTCEDKISLLENIKITASEYYSDHYPEDILRDLIPDYTDLELSDISINDFDTRHTLWHQIVDENLISAIKDILNHFGYFLYMDVDNKLTTRKVRIEVDSVDHEYAEDAGTLINFTPDDNYSSFINRVIVKGEMRNPLEVLYPEEMITGLAGTGGWWDTDDVIETVYFSDDKEKKCRNVRLHVIKSIGDFQILWEESGGTEYISYYDPDELYIKITIELPGLQEVLIALLASIIALGAVAVTCVTSCGVYIMAFTVLVSALGYILGQVATYEYEIYGRPVGEIKQTIQATANDEELQAYLGLVLTEKIDDEFCYTVSSCQTVADYELEVIKAQRKKISFSKIAHLQDEIGDIIKTYHPCSNQALNIFITSLRRTLDTDKNSGKFIDRIEGWNL